MDSLNNLNLSIPNMWEVRDVFNKVKSVMLNYTEMEAKVHDATNNEAWGASSTAMQEIAQATYNHEYFSEIMPTIYKRFTDKEARYWRQIYKALVLLEYLVKNGSERVVDDARSHISMIKMMKNFHYVDDKGKDQGINVRNRSKELAELLGNMDMIKEERKKAKINRNKYTGVGSEGGMSFSNGSYGNGSYGNGSYGNGSYGNGSYGNGSSNYSSGGRFEGFGSSSGQGNSSFYDDERHDRYDTAKRSPSPEPPKIVQSKTARDLFDFDDEPAVTSTPKQQQQQQQKHQSNDDEDDWGDFSNGDGNDDFDDFQSAPVAATVAATAVTPTPAKPARHANSALFDLLGEDTSFVSTPAIQQQQQQQPIPSFDTLSINNEQKTSSPPASTASSTPMNGIWSSGTSLFSLDSLGSNQPTTPPKKTNQGPSMNSLKSNTINNDWNNWATNNTSIKQQLQSTKQSSVFDDLLSL